MADKNDAQALNQPGAFVVTETMRRQIAGAVAEIDMAQMAIIRQMTPAQRARQAASMIDAAERVGALRLRARRPDLSEAEALRIIRGGLLNYERERHKRERNSAWDKMPANLKVGLQTSQDS